MDQGQPKNRQGNLIIRIANQYEYTNEEENTQRIFVNSYQFVIRNKHENSKGKTKRGIYCSKRIDGLHQSDANAAASQSRRKRRSRVIQGQKEDRCRRRSPWEDHWTESRKTGGEEINCLLQDERRRYRRHASHASRAAHVWVFG